MSNDIRLRLKEVLMLNRATVNSISQNTTEQRRLNRQINEDATITSETISSILEVYPQLDANWLLTGKGEMYKHNKAGRDNNVVEGDNKGVVGSRNTTGSIGGNHISLSDTSNLKKIMKEGKISIEFAQSVELLQQQNASLETRVSDLLAQLKTKDELLKAKDDMLALMERLIGKK